MNYIILAGGTGTRLWPLSRNKRPKQLNALITESSMLEDTFGRIRKMADLDKIYIATTKELAHKIQKLIPQLPHQQYILEPGKRDTGPAMALAAAVMTQRAPNEPMIFVPADHYIKDTARYQEILQTAEQVVRNTGKLVSIGIHPTFPSPHLGYLKLGKKLFYHNNIPVYEFHGQIEKPNQQVAQKFLKSGEYLWNANYFTWTPINFIKAYQKHANEGIGRHIKPLIDAIKNQRHKQIYKIYNRMEKISIDYAVMEKIDHHKVVTIKGDFGWADLGGWDALYSALIDASHPQGNLVKAQWHGIDTNDCLIYAPKKKLVATIGIDNLIIIDTPDALLVLPKQRSQDVKKIVEELKQQQKNQYL